MANPEERDQSAHRSTSEGNANEPRPAATQEHSQADGETSRDEVAAMRQPTSNEVSQKTVSQIAAEAEARAKR